MDVPPFSSLLHGWSLTFTMQGTFTPYSLPAFTGAFGLPPFRVCFIEKMRISSFSFLSSSFLHLV